MCDSASLATAAPKPASLPAEGLPLSLTIIISINFSNRASLSRTSPSPDTDPSMLCLAISGSGSSPSYKQSCLERAQFAHGRVLLHFTFLLRHAMHGLASVEACVSLPASSGSIKSDLGTIGTTRVVFGGSLVASRWLLDCDVLRLTVQWSSGTVGLGEASTNSTTSTSNT